LLIRASSYEYTIFTSQYYCSIGFADGSNITINTCTMKVFMISYDLGVPETSADYKLIKDHIEKNYSLWAKPLQSQWLVAVNDLTTATQVRDNIKKLLDTNDKVFVVQIETVQWASYNLPKKVTDWLKAKA